MWRPNLLLGLCRQPCSLQPESPFQKGLSTSMPVVRKCMIFNNSAETARLSTDCKLGTVTSVAEDDEALLSAMREFFVDELQSLVVNTDADKTVRHKVVTKKPGGTPSWRRVARWLFLIAGLLQLDPDTAASTEVHDVQANATNARDPAGSNWKYNSFTSPEYGFAAGAA
ncbi:unnamed protein product [Polarella glacialis]|uniref:Uncharacterized protein n=1 Tax=Polarella glacialis TaxID=89957 RepID=A0A813EUV4_POLGL|nr:unnamed protein product [Polarella glacialis]